MDNVARMVNGKRKIYLIADNIRSAHNVGSILRTADGLGIEKVYLTGYSPYPYGPGDMRLPHIALKAHRQIAKTALGAEKLTKWQHVDDAKAVIMKLRSRGVAIAALEQHKTATPLAKFKSKKNIALIVGNEISGVDQELLSKTDHILHIPMAGHKESFNVAISAAIALYHLRYTT